MGHTSLQGACCTWSGSRDEATSLAKEDIDAQIVTSVPERDGEISEGTLLRVKMRDDLSTATTTAGTKFTAEVMEAITNKGRVIIPIGSHSGWPGHTGPCRQTDLWSGVSASGASKCNAAGWHYVCSPCAAH